MSRLIGADALFAEFENVDWYNNADRDEIAERLVLQAPTIDAVEVVHGEWIAVSSYDAFGGSEELWNAHGNPTAFHYCSNCKAQSYVNEFGEELLTDYCPNCGARMKGEDDE